MDLGPLEGIRAIGAVGVRRSVIDVAPAIAVKGTGRTEEDSYDADEKQPERGLEEEDDEQAESPEGNGGEASAEQAKVNLFA